MPYSTCVRCPNCDGFPCLVHAKSDAEVIGVRPALEHANVTLLTGTRGGAAGDQRRRHAVSEVVVQRDGSETFSGPTSWSSPAAPRTAPSCCSASANDTHPSGLANGSDQVGRNYMFHNSQAVLALSRKENPTVFQKTLGRQRLLPQGQRGLRVSAWQHPDGRQVAGSDVPRREARRDEVRPDLVAGGSRRATRWTSGFRPRICRCPRTGSRSRATATSRSATRPATTRPRSACYDQLKSMLADLGMHHGHLLPASRLPQERDPGRRRRSPGRDVPVRIRSGVVGPQRATAAPTSSTTCTWSTRASSRASAPSIRR